MASALEGTDDETNTRGPTPMMALEQATNYVQYALLVLKI